jgi:hypothetical protein
MEVKFAVNLNNKYGDIIDKCIVIHLDKNFMIRLDNIEHLESFIHKLQICLREIKEIAK